MVKSNEPVFEPEEGVTDLERVVTAPQPAGEKDGDLVAVDTAASERLPFSKARCVALVATIAAAPFLSVRQLEYNLKSGTNIDGRRCRFKLQSSFCLRSARNLVYPLVDNNGSSQHMPSRSVASWYVSTTCRLHKLLNSSIAPMGQAG